MTFFDDFLVNGRQVDMTNSKITEIASKVFDLLEPLESEERKRVVQAAFMLLGEAPVDVSIPSNHKGRGEEPGIHGLPSRAKTWAKQNDISLDQLEEVFQIDGQTVDVIAADVPGANNKDKTYSAYMVVGVSALLSKGEPKFDDKIARALCKTLGCYNEANHSTYLKDRGNELSGSKEKGWILTAPGLKRGAAIIRELTSSDQ